MCMFFITIVVRKRKYLQSVLLLLTFVCVGGTLISIERIAEKVELPNRQMNFKAVVLSRPIVHGKVLQADLMVMVGNKPIKVRASLLRDTISNRYKTLHLGDGIEVTSYLEEPMNFSDATFDYARWLRLHGYSAETFIVYNQWHKAKVNLRQMSLLQRASLAASVYRENLLNVI